MAEALGELVPTPTWAIDEDAIIKKAATISIARVGRRITNQFSGCLAGDRVDQAGTIFICQSAEMQDLMAIHARDLVSSPRAVGSAIVWCTEIGIRGKTVIIYHMRVMKGTSFIFLEVPKTSYVNSCFRHTTFCTIIRTGDKTLLIVAILQRFAHSGYILFSTLDGYLDDDIDLAGVFRVPFNGSAEAASGGAALQQPGEKNDITGDPHLFMNCP